jgi:hypothetical protein
MKGFTVYVLTVNDEGNIELFCNSSSAGLGPTEKFRVAVILKSNPRISNCIIGGFSSAISSISGGTN